MNDQISEVRENRVFISYSRDDVEEAEVLRDELINAGFDAFLDKHDIAPGEPWQERISSLITKSDRLVFLISPASVSSKVAAWEVDQAEAQAKPILPVLIGETPIEEIPGRLRRLHMILYRETDDRVVSLAEIKKALLTNIDWEREKTRINDRAIEWLNNYRSSGLMRSEREIRAAEHWRDSCPEGSIPPTDLQLDFVQASRSNRTNRQQFLVVSLSLGLVFAIGLSVFAFVQKKTAKANEIAALNNEAAALASLSSATLSEGHPADATKFALASWPRSASEPIERLKSSLDAISASVLKSRERLRLEGNGWVQSVAFSADGDRIAVASRQKESVAIWDALTGEALDSIDIPVETSAVDYSADGKLLAVVGRDGFASVFDPKTGERIRKFERFETDKELTSVAISPDSERILIGSTNGTARILDCPSSYELGRLS